MGVSFSVFLWHESSSNFPPAFPKLQSGCACEFWFLIVGFPSTWIESTYGVNFLCYVI
ncbi:hypothetical protein SLEP1_g50312 [Rubroshorea leprosula]|uniref:Uncharacterized protein n=1 Tax=Rubroshorea leprosula TaxID=152421 RepID=A0AAV5LZK6_9ROSI|nr:hypothetical protein SLEP1_g50312 [Rubroshorea leprosula]